MVEYKHNWGTDKKQGEEAEEKKSEIEEKEIFTEKEISRKKDVEFIDSNTITAEKKANEDFRSKLLQNTLIVMIALLVIFVTIFLILEYGTYGEESIQEESIQEEAIVDEEIVIPEAEYTFNSKEELEEMCMIEGEKNPLCRGKVI